MKQARLAVVDDETVVCRRLSQMLARDGYEVEAFTTARAFLERMHEKPFDIVFLDLRLPDMDGLEVLPKVKALRSETEVIIVTGHGAIDTAIEAIKEGAYHYVNKPVKLSEIRVLAKGALEKYGLAFRKAVAGIHHQAMQILNNYSYPGNVRELENIIERAVALAEGDQIRPQDLPQDLQELEFDTMTGEALLTLEELEKRYIAKVLEKTRFNKGLTAQILDVPRTTLWRKLKSYGLE